MEAITPLFLFLTNTRLVLIDNSVTKVISMERKECIKLLNGIIEDVTHNIKNEEIYEEISQLVLTINVGLDFSERGNGDYDDFFEYAWEK